jgi:hypothetical protein
MDGATVNLKRKRDTLYVAPFIGDLAPASFPTNPQRIPGSPWMPLTMLLGAIKNMVPLNTMFQIIPHYVQFVVCK